MEAKKDASTSTTEEEIPGWMEPEELSWLKEKASAMDSVVEIGSWKGRSTRALLKACKGTVYAVDHFQGSPSEIHSSHKEATEKDIHQIFLQNVGMFPNLICLKMDSLEAAGRFEDKSVDMVFIDGDHEGRAFHRDLDAWLPKARKLICGHDITMGDIEKIIKEVIGQFDRGPASIWYKWFF